MPAMKLDIQASGSDNDAKSEQTPLLLSPSHDKEDDTSASAPPPARRGLTLAHISTLLKGQFLSLCLCITGVFSELLVTSYDISLPMTQILPTYLILAAAFVPVMVVHGTFWSTLKSNWLAFAFVSLADVESNYLSVRAYSLTTITSVQVLDCFAIPGVVLLSYVVLRRRYLRAQYLFIAVCIAGMGLIVVADIRQDHKGGAAGARDRVLGDVFAVVSAVGIAISNVAQEKFVRGYSLSQYLGMLGLFGSLLSGVQAAVLEGSSIAVTDWSLGPVTLFGAFNVTLAWYYVAASLFLSHSTAVVLNLSVLTSDIYSLLFGILLFHNQVSWLYGVAFVTVILGLSGYVIAGTSDTT